MGILITYVRGDRALVTGVTSPVMVPTLQDRAGQLAALGWTGHEVEWLALVALHSGVLTQSGAKVHRDSRRPPAAMVRRRSAVRAWRRCPARWRGRGAFPQGYIRTGATPPAGGGSDTRCLTLPPSPCRTSGKKRGVAPVTSRSAGAVRVVRSRTNNRNNDSEQWKGGPDTPPAVFLTPPGVRVRLCSPPGLALRFDPGTVQRTGHH